MSLLGHILFFLIGSHITCSEYNCAHYFTIRIDTIILILLSFCTGKLHHSIFLYHCIDWFMNNQLSGINKCGVQTKIWSDIKTMRYKREIYLMWKKQVSESHIELAALFVWSVSKKFSRWFYDKKFSKLWNHMFASSLGAMTQANVVY